MSRDHDAGGCGGMQDGLMTSWARSIGTVRRHRTEAPEARCAHTCTHTSSLQFGSHRALSLRLSARGLSAPGGFPPGKATCTYISIALGPQEKDHAGFLPLQQAPHKKKKDSTSLVAWRPHIHAHDSSM